MASPEAYCYRNLLIRAIKGDPPALKHPVADEALLMRVCEHLAEAERAAEILQHKGYGKPGAGLLLHELAALVPEKA